ncbi:MAG: hypothetical protein ACON5A_06130 [Candidatus Comchoanobacterales bacterium]
MLKRLSKFGNSKGIVLDKTILALLGLNDDSFVNIEIHGKSLTITPAQINLKEQLKQNQIDTINYLTAENDSDYEKIYSDPMFENMSRDEAEKLRCYWINRAKETKTLIEKTPTDDLTQYESSMHAINQYMMSDKAVKLQKDLHNHPKHPELIEMMTVKKSPSTIMDDAPSTQELGTNLQERVLQMQNKVKEFWKNNDLDIYNRIIEQEKDLAEIQKSIGSSE